MKPTYVGHLWFNRKMTNLYRHWTYGNHWILKIELCTITCAKAGGQDGRQVHNLVLNRDFNYSNQFLLENSNLFGILVVKVWRLSGEQLVSLMNEDVNCVLFSAQHTICTPYRDVLPHRHITNNDIFLILNFRRVLIVVSFLLGKSPTSVYHCMPTFRNYISVPSSKAMVEH